MKTENKTYVHFRCTPEMKETLLKIAKDEERTLSGQVVYFLKKSIQQYKVNGSG